MESTKFTKVTPQNACVHCGCCKNGFGRRLSGKLVFPLCPLCCTSQPKSQPSEARAPAAAGPLAPPPPAASRARADTTRGPRWGLSLRRGRLSRVRGRTLAAGRGGAGPSAAAGSLARVRARKYARMESPRQHRLISLPRMQDGP